MTEPVKEGGSESLGGIERSNVAPHDFDDDFSDEEDDPIRG